MEGTMQREMPFPFRRFRCSTGEWRVKTEDYES